MNRLEGLEVQEVSLVDDPAVPEARYLIVKRNSPVATEGMTDTTKKSLSERLGQAVFDMLGGKPADEQTRALIAKHLADAEAESVEGEGAEAPESEETEKAAEAEQPAEEEAEKAAESEEADEAADEAEKASRPKCDKCGQYLPENGDERHKSADAEGEAESTEAAAAEEETEKAAADPVAEQVTALTETVKTLTDNITALTEGLSKNLDATTALSDRLTAIETRKGVSKSLNGSEVSAEAKGMYESVIFGR